MALVPPSYLNTVVAIGVPAADTTRWIASGFLYADVLRRLDDGGAMYRLLLVSNRHVLADKKSVVLRFNPQGTAPAKEFTIHFGDENPASLKLHPNSSVDLAAVLLNPSVLDAHSIEYGYFLSDTQVADLAVAEESGFAEGDFCYLLGFPQGLVGETRNYVICRHGNIARISDFLRGHCAHILVDCMTFPGNSGGPIVTKPELTAIKRTKSQKQAYLLGVVSSYIPYTDVAISSQTGRPRVTFEENSGLTRVVPAHTLKDWIDSLAEHSQEDAEIAEMSVCE